MPTCKDWIVSRPIQIASWHVQHGHTPAAEAAPEETAPTDRRRRLLVERTVHRLLTLLPLAPPVVQARPPLALAHRPGENMRVERARVGGRTGTPAVRAGRADHRHLESETITCGAGHSLTLHATAPGQYTKSGTRMGVSPIDFDATPPIFVRSSTSFLRK